jgi:hypothetical protein
LFGACGLCHQLGTDDHLRPRDLRRTILRWLHVIQVFWRDCPASVANDGRSVQLQPARAIHSRATPSGPSSPHKCNTERPLGIEASKGRSFGAVP